jgi:hypothetical protein
MKRSDQKSIVAERLASFVGKSIALRVAWDPRADVVGEYVDVKPIGRPYFVVLRVGDRERLINIEHVIEIAEVIS